MDRSRLVTLAFLGLSVVLLVAAVGFGLSGHQLEGFGASLGAWGAALIYGRRMDPW